jgi:hypothetical protein
VDPAQHLQPLDHPTEGGEALPIRIAPATNVATAAIVTISLVAPCGERRRDMGRKINTLPA